MAIKFTNHLSNVMQMTIIALQTLHSLTYVQLFQKCHTPLNTVKKIIQKKIIISNKMKQRSRTTYSLTFYHYTVKFLQISLKLIK